MLRRKEQRATPNLEVETKPRRRAEVVIDSKNPPLLVNVIPDLDEINAFFNERAGNREGVITITLAGSSSDRLKQVFSNKYRIDWKYELGVLITERPKAIQATASRVTGNIEIFVDDVLYWHILESVLRHKDFDGNEIAEFMRSLFKGSKALWLEPGLPLSKTLQHELDHAAQTKSEIENKQLLAPRHLTRAVSSAGLISLWLIAAAHKQFDMNVTLAISGGCFFALSTYLDYLIRKNNGEEPDYDVDPVEISARKASETDMNLLQISRSDLLWLEDQIMEAISGFEPQEWQITPEPILQKMNFAFKKLMRGERAY